MASCAPVLAPLGTAARPSAPSHSFTSTSTVGLPRLSRISRARIDSIDIPFVLATWCLAIAILWQLYELSSFLAMHEVLGARTKHQELEEKKGLRRGRGREPLWCAVIPGAW